MQIDFETTSQLTCFVGNWHVCASKGQQINRFTHYTCQSVKLKAFKRQVWFRNIFPHPWRGHPCWKPHKNNGTSSGICRLNGEPTGLPRWIRTHLFLCDLAHLGIWNYRFLPEVLKSIVFFLGAYLITNLHQAWLHFILERFTILFQGVKYMFEHVLLELAGWWKVQRIARCSVFFLGVLSVKVFCPCTVTHEGSLDVVFIRLWSQPACGFSSYFPSPRILALKDIPRGLYNHSSITTGYKMI